MGFIGNYYRILKVGGVEAPVFREKWREGNELDDYYPLLSMKPPNLLSTDVDVNELSSPLVACPLST